MIELIEAINGILYQFLPNDFIISLFLKSSLIVGASWMASILFKKYTAEVKHKVWSFCLGIILLVALLPYPGGTWRIELYDENASNSLTYLKHQDKGQNMLPADFNQNPSDLQWSSAFSEIVFIEWLSFVWIIGVALLALLMIVETIWIWRIRLMAGCCTQERILLSLSMAAGDLNLRKSVLITLSKRVTSPLAFGYFSPVIVLPSSALKWDHQKIRTVLLHELAHIKRNDYLFNLLGNLVLAINWFNPLVWLANRQLKSECEKACDEMALEKDLTPTAYALSLLQIAKESSKNKPSYPKLAVAMSGFTDLKDRIQNILSKDDNKSLSTEMLQLMLFGMIAVSTSIITLSFSKTPLNQKEIQELLLLTNDDNYKTRLAATGRLRYANDPMIINPLMKALEKETDEDIKTNLITAIGKFGDNRTFYLVASNLYTADENQKIEILKSLYAIGCFPSYLLLKASINDPNPRVSGLAASLLGQFDSGKLSKSIRDFSEVLLHSDWSLRLSNKLDKINGYHHIDQLKRLYQINDMNLKRGLNYQLEEIASNQNFQQLESFINQVQ